MKEFLNLAMTDICEEPKLIKLGPIDKYSIWDGSDSTFGEIKCIKAGNEKKAIDIKLAKMKEENKKKKEQEKLLAKQIKEKQQAKKEEELLQASINEKKEVCKTMGFVDETNEMANCILQLTLLEKKGDNSNTTSSNSTSSQKEKELDIMQEQTNIMKKKLEQQQKEYLIQQQELETQKKLYRIERKRQLERAGQIFRDIGQGKY